MAWVEASIWSKRMLSALVNGVKGGKWYSLIDNILKGLERWTPTGGTPQGGVLSPLLAN